MAAPMTIENHHFIPEFYLKPWLSDQDKKLEEYGRVPPSMDIRSRRWVRSKTGMIPNLYTLPGVTEATKQNVERVFYQQVDTSAAQVRDKLLIRAELSDKDLYVWARFMLSLGIRNPTEMEKFKERLRRDFVKPDARLEARWAEVRREGQPATVEEALLQLNPHTPEIGAILITTKLVQNQNIIKTIMGMDWMVYDASTSNRKFLTCDRPLIMTPFGRDDAQMVLPMSPDKLLTIFKNPDFNDELQFMNPSSVVEATNKLIIGQAREKVYAVDNSYLTEVRAGMSSGEYFSLAMEPRKPVD
jgi:hypothetical protein